MRWAIALLCAGAWGVCVCEEPQCPGLVAQDHTADLNVTSSSLLSVVSVLSLRSATGP